MRQLGLAATPFSIARRKAAVWDPALDPSSLPTPDDYWSAPMQRKLVRIDDEVSQPLEGIPSSAVFSTLDHAWTASCTC